MGSRDASVRSWGRPLRPGCSGLTNLDAGDVELVNEVGGRRANRGVFEVGKREVDVGHVEAGLCVVKLAREFRWPYGYPLTCLTELLASCPAYRVIWRHRASGIGPCGRLGHILPHAMVGTQG